MSQAVTNYVSSFKSLMIASISPEYVGFSSGFFWTLLEDISFTMEHPIITLVLSTTLGITCQNGLKYATDRLPEPFKKTIPSILIVGFVYSMYRRKTSGCRSIFDISFTWGNNSSFTCRPKRVPVTSETRSSMPRFSYESRIVSATPSVPVELSIPTVPPVPVPLTVPATSDEQIVEKVEEPVVTDSLKEQFLDQQNGTMY